MKELLLLCAGAHGRTALEILRTDPGLTVAGFLDDQAQARLAELAHLGPLSQLEQRVPGAAFVGLGNIRWLQQRNQLFERAEKAGFEMVSAVHSRAFVCPSAQCGSGLFLGPMSLVHANARVGRNVCIYSGSAVEHDAHLSDHVFLGPGVHLGGSARLEEGAYLSLGAKIAWGVQVGAYSLVAAGAVVLQDVPAGAVVMGTPARVVGTVQEWLERQEGKT